MVIIQKQIDTQLCQGRNQTAKLIQYVNYSLWTLHANMFLNQTKYCSQSEASGCCSVDKLVSLPVLVNQVFQIKNENSFVQNIAERRILMKYVRYALKRMLNQILDYTCVVSGLCNQVSGSAKPNLAGQSQPV